MVERATRRPSPRSTARVAATALLVVLAGCSAESGDDADAACSPPRPAPPAETALMPDGLSFDRIGTVTRVVSTEGHITVRAVAAKPLDEVTVLIQDAVTAAGYRPAGMDNEGFEAEVFFTSGSYAAGQAIVRRAECEDRWDIDLVLIDPDVVPAPPALPTTTTETP
ncbi:hypothetical protein [Actinophytocola sp.]|uniref:hypothetical protein n=1 Tax=Actinophytocola sp. TaxID=1872138 RepID=UPI003D6B417C